MVFLQKKIKSKQVLRKKQKQNNLENSPEKKCCWSVSFFKTFSRLRHSLGFIYEQKKIRQKQKQAFGQFKK
jgi:hypothetical protein